MLFITPLYAAPLALFYILLSFRTVLYRKAQGISLGDGDDLILRARIRAHGNFAEYAPFGLLLMALAELAGAGPIWVHLSGVTLTIGRLAHAWAVGWHGPMGARVLGMATTFFSLTVAALSGIVAAIW